jgi:hypothetical protein
LSGCAPEASFNPEAMEDRRDDRDRGGHAQLPHTVAAVSEATGGSAGERVWAIED